MNPRYFGAAGVLALGIAVALSADTTRLSAMQKAAQNATTGTFTMIGCVERDNGTAMAGAAGSGTSTAANATSGSNAASYKLTQIDRESLDQMNAELGKTQAVTGSASTTGSPVTDPSMKIDKATDFVLRPINGKVKISHFVNQRVAVTGKLIDAAIQMAAPTSAGATGTAGTTGTVNTSNLNTPGLNVTYVEKVPGSCK